MSFSTPTECFANNKRHSFQVARQWVQKSPRRVRTRPLIPTSTSCRRRPCIFSKWTILALVMSHVRTEDWSPVWLVRKLMGTCCGVASPLLELPKPLDKSPLPLLMGPFVGKRHLENAMHSRDVENEGPVRAHSHALEYLLGQRDARIQSVLHKSEEYDKSRAG